MTSNLKVAHRTPTVVEQWACVIEPTGDCWVPEGAVWPHGEDAGAWLNAVSNERKSGAELDGWAMLNVPGAGVIAWLSTPHRIDGRETSATLFQVRRTDFTAEELIDRARWDAGSQLECIIEPSGDWWIPDGAYWPLGMDPIEWAAGLPHLPASGAHLDGWELLDVHGLSVIAWLATPLGEFGATLLQLRRTGLSAGEMAERVRWEAGGRWECVVESNGDWWIPEGAFWPDSEDGAYWAEHLPKAPKSGATADGWELLDVGGIGVVAWLATPNRDPELPAWAPRTATRLQVHVSDFTAAELAGRAMDTTRGTLEPT